MISGNTRHMARAGLRIATQHPTLIHWYLQNRLRNSLLPLERLDGAGRSRGPRYITLKPTLRCNLRCEFCRFVANGDVFGKRDWLGIDDWRRVIDEVAPYRPYFCITGGEPTLYPHLPQLIAHIKQHGLVCVVTTNGTLLERRAEALLQAPPDVLILSLDGPREVHDSVRGVPGTFDRLTRGLTALRRAGTPEENTKARKSENAKANEMGAGGLDGSKYALRTTHYASANPRQNAQRPAPNSPYVVLNTAITGRTYESAREMVALAREWGAFALNFQHFWFMTPGMVEAHNARWSECFPLSFERIGGTMTEGVDTDQVFDTIRRLKSEDSGLPVLFYPELTREEMRTYYGDPEAFTTRATPTCAWTSTDIMPNGDVSPCFELVAGNVLRQPFREIWNSEPFRAHRRRLAAEGPYPVCARCCAYFRRD